MRDLPGVRPAVTRDERDNRGPVAHEHERLHDLPERAADRVGGGAGRRGRGRKLLEPRLGAGLAQEAGDALDRLRPLHDAAHPSSTKRTSSKPTSCNASTSSSVAGVSIEKTINASPPSRFRETAMFAMFTPASPNIEPTRPITPGRSS